MKRLALIAAMVAALAAAAAAQSMMQAKPASDASGMMAAPEKGDGWKVMYSDLKDAQALATMRPTVLFFNADWCPTCKAALKDFEANGSRLGDIAIVIVNYDKNPDLKARYGISVQHTFVQIDAKGARLARWNGGGVDDVLKNIKRSM